MNREDCTLHTDNRSSVVMESGGRATCDVSAGLPAGALRLVSSRACLPLSLDDAPPAWQAGMADLLCWLGIVVESPATAEERQPSLATAPWRPVPSASIFDDVPATGWVASYLLEQGSGLMLPRGGIDVMLLSPHPAADAPQVWEAMLGTAQAEGRERIAVVLPDGTHDAPGFIRGGSGAAIFMTEAMRTLSAGAIPWDAIVVMPHLRERLFARLSAISRVRGPWPMLRYKGETCLIGAEGSRRDAAREPFDAHLLIQSLALALRRARRTAAARRLHEAWARLRDTGITTAGRGRAGPYASIVSDDALVAMICRGMAQSRRDISGWKALGDNVTSRGSQMPLLRVVMRDGTVLP